jgi:WD40 repeat protein
MLKFLAITLAFSSLGVQDTLEFEFFVSKHTKSIDSVDFGMDFDRARRRDASFVVSGSQDGSAMVWDLGSKAMRHHLVHTLAGTQGARIPVNRVRVTKDGRRVAVAGADGRVTLWDPRSGQRIHELAHHTGRVWDIGWSADGTKLASCDDDGKVVVWDAMGGTILKQFASDKDDQVITALSMSPDGRTVVFGSRGDKLYFGNIETGARYNVVSDLGEEPKEIEFSPDGRWIACAEGKTLVVRQGIDGKKVRGFGGHAGTIRGFKWSSNGERIVTAGDGGELFEWSMQTSTVIAKAKVAQYINDVTICLVNGVEKFALAKPSHRIEMQK